MSIEEKDISIQLEEMKRSQDKQMTVILDLSLRLSAISQLLISKKVITEEELGHELEELGRQLAGTVHLALQNAVKEAKNPQT